MPQYAIRYTKHAAERMKLYGITPPEAVNLLKESVETILPHNFHLKTKYKNTGPITRWENGYYYINVVLDKDKYTGKNVYLILTIFDKRMSISPRNYKF